MRSIDPSYVDAVQTIEDHTAEILNGRESCLDLELLLRSLARWGKLDMKEYQDAMNHLGAIRRGLELGRRYAQRARRNPVP